MATTRGSLFDPTLVKDLVSKVTGSGGTVIGTAFRGAVCQSDGIQFGKGYSKDHLDKNAVERPSFVIPVKIFAVKGVI